MLFSVIPVEEPSISSITERSHSMLVKMLFTPAKWKKEKSERSRTGFDEPNKAAVKVVFRAI